VRENDAPVYRQKRQRSRPKLDAFAERLEAMFKADRLRPPRERRSAQRLYEDLIAEGYTGSYATVRRFVRDLRAQEPDLSNGFIPLLFEPGDAMQFDWSEEDQ
jgi:transposase